MNDDDFHPWQDLILGGILGSRQFTNILLAVLAVLIWWKW